MTNLPIPLSTPQIRPALQLALQEDLGDYGDITSNSTIPADTEIKAMVQSREDGVCSGLLVAEESFALMGAGLHVTHHTQDGARIAPGQTLMTIEGNARALLSAERTALNFMGRMCGIATETKRYVDAVSHTSARICDTRKTTPGLRLFDKYAVRCGGGNNHRFGLYDAVLIKDNHIAACGSVKNAILSARNKVGHMVRIEVEIDYLDQLPEALDAKADIIMLDNMNAEDMRQAVKDIKGRALVEASGSVSLERVSEIAECGVDLISIGRLTHSIRNFDIGLDMD